jgi:hypothetical protein
MTEEFRKIGPTTITSTAGFTVEVKFPGGIVYRDDQGETHIDSEWLGEPNRLLLYKSSVEKLAPDRVGSIISNVARAVEYMGYPVVVWPDDDPNARCSFYPVGSIRWDNS